MRHKFLIGTSSIQKNQIIEWCTSFHYASFLDSNQYPDRYSNFDWIAALGAHKIFTSTEDPFEALNKGLSANDWLFGHLSYDLKNFVEKLNTRHDDKLGFTPLLFFIPETVVYKNGVEVWVESLLYSSEKELLKNIPQGSGSTKNIQYELKPKTSKEQYLQKIQSLKHELQFGNIYEINFCIEFAEHTTDFDPAYSFQKLNKSAAAPFSAFYKNEKAHLMCASPERYLQKKQQQIISQPIKGTIKRSHNPEEDLQLKEDLIQNEKERSENVMITDLVRNDLSRTAARGFVSVEELFGIYTFNTVHQMITTVKSELKSDCTITDLLKTTFPMGSMTGAPKIRAMKLIDSHENFARNLYSGAVGYITPEGDFDFNVVIRSLFYNAESNYLSARVGSAITIHCEAEKEYEECLLKAENLFATLRA